MRHLNKLRLMEFLIVGLLMGTIEDLIAISFATDATLDLRVVFVAFFVALPFAFISEIIVDHPLFWQKILRKG